MTQAFHRVISNKGAAGVDGITVGNFRTLLLQSWSSIKAKILEGKYKPTSVREVEIPKPNGGKRKLGIPTVMDRLIQQAISQRLNQIYDKEFSESSYGFRPKRNAHQAVEQAKQYLNEGNTYVIEMDLEKFFDKVNHDKMMNLLARKIQDKRLLKLIRSYLTSGIMIGGVEQRREAGTPQGSPLSPLLSNIILDTLDKELEKRGHKFVRYADDCSIYVKSNKAAERVKASITKFIEEKLLLKVNKEKTRISRPNQSTLLGFSFYKDSKGYQIRIAPTSLQRIKEKVKGITSRRKPHALDQRLQSLRPIIMGWVNYFRAGNSTAAFAGVRYWMEKKIRRVAMKKRQRRGFGWKRWSSQEIYRDWGLFNDYGLSRMRFQAKAAPA